MFGFVDASRNLHFLLHLVIRVFTRNLFYMLEEKPNMHYDAEAVIFKRAEELRNNMTPAEKLLWEFLKDNKSQLKFRRQHPILFYVADFYCHALKLVIELDGSIHDDKSVKAYDVAREQELKSLGLTILR